MGSGGPVTDGLSAERLAPRQAGRLSTASGRAQRGAIRGPEDEGDVLRLIPHTEGRGMEGEEEYDVRWRPTRQPAGWRPDQGTRVSSGGHLAKSLTSRCCQGEIVHHGMYSLLFSTEHFPLIIL